MSKKISFCLKKIFFWRLKKQLINFIIQKNYFLYYCIFVSYCSFLDCWVGYLSCCRSSRFYIKNAWPKVPNILKFSPILSSYDSTLLYSTLLCSILLFTTLLFSTLLYSSVVYSTLHYYSLLLYYLLKMYIVPLGNSEA